MATLYSREDLARVFDPSALERGRAYHHDHRVRRVTIANDGGTISGTVAGQRRKPYDQIISIRREGERVRISGYCSCPVGRDCKHVAAVLLDCLACDAETSAGGQECPGLSSTPAIMAAAQPTDATERAGATVSDELARWLDRLVTAHEEGNAGPQGRAKGPRGFFYVLNHAERNADRRLASLRPVVARMRKDGSIAEEKPYDPENATRPKEQIARFLTGEDIDILRDLVWLKRACLASSPDIVLPPEALSARVLAGALATGRVRLHRADGVALASGPTVRADVRWIKTADGAQRLALAAEANGEASHFVGELLPLAPPQYMDPNRGLVGVIETGLSPKLAAEVARAPAVPASEAALVRELMRQRLAADTQLAGSDARTKHAHGPLPLPDAPENVETRMIAPVPCLELFLAGARLKPTFSWYGSDPRHGGGFHVPLARLAFDYGGQAIGHAAPAACLQRFEDGKLILVPRDTAAEQAVGKRLGRLGFDAPAHAPFRLEPGHENAFFLYPTARRNGYELVATFDDPARFLAFSVDTAPVLEAEGWRIAYSDDYPYRIAKGETTWWAETAEGSGIDWFSFELGIEFEGHRINLIPTLARLIGELPANVAAVARGTGEAEWLKLCAKLRLHHTLDDGRLLPLPGDRLAPILKALIELVGPRRERMDGGRIAMHRAEAAALAAFAGEAGAHLAWAVDSKRLIELGDRLRKGERVAKVKPPASFKASLRPYQTQGLGWLDFLRDAGFGGVLADDMGLGKTVQALAFLTREKAEGRLDRPALVVAPTSVLPNWKAETARFAPRLSVLPLHGPARSQRFAEIPAHDVVLTTYPLLARDAGTLLAQEFHAAILDEAQAIKNPKAAVAGIAHKINARHRLALTGTPLENNLGEVWSLFQFLSPGLLGDESQFRRTFRTPIEKHGCTEAQAFLSRRLKPFMLRRTKDKVAKELPRKTEIVERVSLEGAQRDLYETVRALMHDKVREAIDKQGLAKSHIVFLDALLKLRQVCCDPRLLKLPAARRVRTSAKLERLMEMLPDLIAEGRRVLLFSQFTSMLELIEEELARAKISWVKLTGQTQDREAVVRAFQEGQAPLFLLSLKAGGTGLNLTAADTVIHYDPWWNPAVENQATDRAHRIGQTKPVFVYKLIVEEGIEQAIELLKARKAALADALFAGGANAPLDLTEADISALFAPLSRAPERLAA